MDFIQREPLQRNNKVHLSQRKGSTVVPPSGESTPGTATPGSACVPFEGPAPHDKTYPFAMVLRLRVLQIVCGISAMVMGTVAFIEEGSELNLGLGIPAGAATILAAAASVHTSRGFGGYEPSSCSGRGPVWAALRFLGPSARVAVPLALLWAAACALHATLLVQAARTLVDAGGGSTADAASLASLVTAASAATSASAEVSGDDVAAAGGATWVSGPAGAEPQPPPPRDLVVLAAVQLALAALTITVVLVLLRVDCVFDPD